MPRPPEKNARRRAKSVLILLQPWELEPIQEALKMDGTATMAEWIRNALAKAAKASAARDSRRRARQT